MQSFYNLNGKLHSSDTPCINPDNRAFRYGEGLFETMRFTGAGIPLWAFHQERLIQALQLLGITLPAFFSFEQLQNEIRSLAQKNQHAPDARIRLTVFRGDGGIWDQPKTEFQYLIQTWPLEKSSFNENGLDVDLFPHGRKAVDLYSGLKSSNYLIYLSAARFAKEIKVNECLVLNQYGRIADGTISNVFVVKEGVVITPPLSEAGIAGTMRRYLMEQLFLKGYRVIEKPLGEEDLLHSSELFLSNAISGIRWVKSCGSQTYNCGMSARIFNEIIRPLFL
ncbi:MAG: aminotransferase class IV [Lacibacter sp.]